MSRSFFSAVPATVAVEIARHRISAASVSSRGASLSVTAHALEPLEQGSVVPSLTTSNIADAKSLSAVLVRVFDRMGVRPKRVALAIPDGVAKVSLLRFEKVPDRHHDLDELIRWQVRKAVPFSVEDAQLTYMRGQTAPDGSTEFVVVIARRDIIREYEAVCEAAGAQAGLVDLATFNVINSVLASPDAPSGDWLLVHVTPEEATMTILRGQHLVFFRNRTADGEGGLADMVHQTSMYYEDRLNGAGFGRVILAGAGSGGADTRQDADYLRRQLEQRLGTKVDGVDPLRAVTITDRIMVATELRDALAPLVGLLARERAA